MANETEARPFDFRQCPYCDSVIDYMRDRHPGRYSLSKFAFRCHSCGVEYEVSPIIAGYEARKITAEEVFDGHHDKA